jgi:hypothetical protein
VASKSTTERRWSRHENALVLKDALLEEGFDVTHDKYKVADALRVRVPGRTKPKGLIAVWDDGKIVIMIGNKRQIEYQGEPSLREILQRHGLGEFIEPPPPEER